MAEIIARFADGRLLVQEDRVCEVRYDATIGVPVRIGHVRLVEKVLSIDTDISGYSEKLITRLKDVKVSGDTIFVKMLRGDMGSPTMTGLFSGILVSGVGGAVLSGQWGLSGFILSGIVTLTGPIGSGAVALSVLSGMTSGLAFPDGQVLSGNINISGRVRVVANIIGY